MNILVNKKIKRLFCQVLLFSAAFTLLSAVLTPKSAGHGGFLLPLCMGVCILAAMLRYFREQNKIMENAVAQIREYSAGNQNARIECDEEGELYRLFHEVNSLVSVLNAHAENEGKAKGFMRDTLSDISHQLKTPLAALNIYNGILQQETRALPAVAAFTDLSEQELDRIETLVQNLLKIAKLDAGAIVIEKNAENVSEMMGGLERRFAYRAGQEKKHLTLSGNEEITLSCDRVWLMEAVGNLLKNAFDHTGAGDTISLTWKQFASVVQIVVRDDGSGIHPEDLNHIFKRFYRSRFSKDTQGVGLGLPLAKAVVEAHDGTIEVDSTWGYGAAFTINFLIPTKL